MIDFHTHSIFSDGELIPFELIRRAEAIGYKAIAVTDHMDTSNMDFILPRMVKAVEKIREHAGITVIAGAELTHVPPGLIPELIKEARGLGAQIVVVHGETIVEPVREGTNRAAIEGGADILAHPGLITEDDARFAADKGIVLEITARKGHSLANGHVAAIAYRHNIPLTINTDAHAPSDLITKDFAVKVLAASGMNAERIEKVFDTSKSILERILRR